MVVPSLCHICGNELIEPTRRLVGICGSTACVHAWARQMQVFRRAEKLKQNQRRHNVAVVYMDQELARHGIAGHEKILPLVVPANLRRIVNLPERRKRAFRDHLTKSLSQAAALRACSSGRASGDNPTAKSSIEVDPLMVRGCATCRGRCCNNAREHAYQDVANLVAYMHRHPDRRPRHVLKDYLDRLPNKAYEDSCFYHTETGCVLPREMRAAICNQFYCEELRDVQRQFPRGPAGDVMYVAFEKTRVVRAEPLERMMTNLLSRKAIFQDS